MSGRFVIPPRTRCRSRWTCRPCSTPSLTKQLPEHGSRGLCRTRGSRKACWNMLNELYTLDRALNRFRVNVQESHPWVKRLGRSPLLIAGVDSSGAVAEIGQMDTQDAVSLFKIQPSNQANFPQATWNGPIWNLDRTSGAALEWLGCPVKEVRRRAELLRGVCAGADIATGQGRAVTRMREFCRELAERFPRDDESEFAAFPVLLRRLLGAGYTPEEWLRRLSDVAPARKCSA